MAVIYMQTKPCPFCGEEILAIAKKCKHCGEFLDDALKKKRKEQPQKVQREGCFLQTLNAGCIIIAVIFVIIAIIILVVLGSV